MGKGDAPEVEETPEERALAEVAAAQLERYGEVFVPLENEYMKRVRMTPDEYAFAEGETANQIGGQFDDALDQQQARLGVRGVAPGSGASVDAMGEGYERMGESLALGRTAAENEVEDLHYRGLENVIAMGQGIAGDANLGLQQVAGNAVSEASGNAWREMEEDNARAHAIGLAGGFATRGWQEGG